MARTYTTTRATHPPSAGQRRTTVAFILMLGIIGVVVARITFLQVMSHEKYSALASRQHMMEKVLPASRGEIFLKNQDTVYPIAVNREYFLAYISPRDVPDDQLLDVTHRVVAALDVPRETVMTKLAKRDDIHEVLKHKITAEEKDAIVAEHIPGLFFMPEFFRFYPGGSLGAQVVGFVGSDGDQYVGRYGIEAVFDKAMHGTDGRVVQLRDARGGWMSNADRTVEEPRDGNDVYLTIEYPVQFEVERILKEAVSEYGARSGAIVVMEPATGKILAMANEPTFVPNEYNNVTDVSVFRNSVVSDEYECGSVFKPLTMAMGLDAGKVTPETTYTDTGSVKVAEYTIKNSENKVYGVQTMNGVLEESINTGVIHVERLIGNAAFKHYVERFGFGAVTGVDLPAEADGNIGNLANVRRDVEYYTASFGQGITVTLLQVAAAYGALANGGELMMPRIVEKTVDADGVEHTVAPHTVHRVISQEASQTIGQMLRRVVTDGHGKRADVPGYLIAGKTGTAQVAKSDAKGYDESRTVGTFAGYGPVNDPRFVIVVRIDEPTKVIWAESSAAPTFGKVMKFVLDYYGIVPTEPITSAPSPRPADLADVGSP